MPLKSRQSCSAGAKPWLLSSLLVLTMLLPIAGQANLEQAMAHYQNEYYEEALELLQGLDQTTTDLAGQRYLGLTYYQLQDSTAARPLLAASVGADPQDQEVRLALADILLQEGAAQEALGHVESLPSHGPQADHLIGRIYLALGQNTQAIQAFERVLAAAEADLIQDASIDLLPLYLAQGQLGEARRTAEQGIALDPESVAAGFLRNYLARIPGEGADGFELYLGYRVEHDNNVLLDSDQPGVQRQAEDEADTRQVFTADLLNEWSLGHGFDLYGEAHLYQSLHQDLDTFDETRVNLVGSLGWDRAQWGVRMPIEYTYNLLDGTDYLNSYQLTPGFYYRWNQAFLHGYGRYQNNDYDEQVDAGEDRSGRRTGFGALLRWPLAGDKGQLGLILEQHHDDTDGRNWDRDEIKVSLYGEYQLLPKLSLTLGYQWDDHDFRQVHDIFFIKRDDQGQTLFGSLAYHINAHWKVQLQASQVDWDSNIGLYSYEREVISLGFSWQR